MVEEREVLFVDEVLSELPLDLNDLENDDPARHSNLVHLGVILDVCVDFPLDSQSPPFPELGDVVLGESDDQTHIEKWSPASWDAVVANEIE